MAESTEQDGGWGEWKRHVLIETEDHRSRLADLEKEQQRLAISLETIRTELKLKSGVFALVGTLISLSVLALIEYFKK